MSSNFTNPNHRQKDGIKRYFLASKREQGFAMKEK